MGRLERTRKLRRLEGRTGDMAAAVVALEQVRRERALSEVVARLSDADLRTLDTLLDVALEPTLADPETGAPPSLWELPAEGSGGASDREALEHLSSALAELGLDERSL